MATAAPPSRAIMSAVSSIVSGRLYGDGLPRVLRPVQITVAPASPRARAIARPAPRVAPATTAICPESVDVVIYLSEKPHHGGHGGSHGGHGFLCTTKNAVTSVNPPCPQW